MLPKPQILSAFERGTLGYSAFTMWETTAIFVKAKMLSVRKVRKNLANCTRSFTNTDLVSYIVKPL